MSDFLSTIRRTLPLIEPLSRTNRVIVALSGGADSVALLCALCELGYECTAAHCDFHLRGDESERDRIHAATVAEMLGADYEEIHFDVDEYRRTHSVSVEMACRELRYGWFHSLSESLGNIPVAVAHHREDNVETLFLNLFRGTGISGLTGMKFVNGIIVRPMLDASRGEIELYLNKRGISYVTDSSNLLNDVKRNRIRNLIMPAIKEQFPDAGQGLSATMDNLARTESLYRELIERQRQKYVSGQGNIVDINLLLAESREPATLLFELIREKGFNFTQASNIVSAALGQTASGKVFKSDSCTAALDRGLLRITVQSNGAVVASTFSLDMTKEGYAQPGINVSRIVRDKLTFDRSGMSLYLDSSVLDGNPEFELRHWHEGDRIAPFGMKGTRLVSDIFSDAKLSVDDKRRIWILTRNGLILWIVGLRTSRHFPVTDSTTEIIRLHFSI
ncbi:MAG: tRNA lysidine(34) synthetase TilS [Muribaculum sp.]|nr:tRNA lysidine(34) synthetase TilS [Muribaculum sp.]